jgi:hypothetical protein
VCQLNRKFDKQNTVVLLMMVGIGCMMHVATCNMLCSAYRGRGCS